MAITRILILLIRWLMLLPLSEEEQVSIAALLETDEERIALMDYLSENRTPTHDEIMNEVGRIIKSTSKKQSNS